ncbi:sensor histidine kinase [Fodinicola feengrottensis]|uniref:sensor histidine kinase n=1 Tax=Fodinicola feengrottensis TaxID=435914 RepID=UPI0031DE5308
MASLLLTSTTVAPMWRIGLAILTCALTFGLAVMYAGPPRVPLLAISAFSFLLALLPVLERIDVWLARVGTVLLFLVFAAVIWRGRAAAMQLLVRDRYRASIDAVDAMKSHLAHQLHDEFLQRLLSARQLLQQAKLSHSPTETMSLVTRADDLFFAQATDLRGLITDLHPAVLDRIGLAGALADLASDTEIEHPGKTVATTVLPGHRPEWTQDRTLRLALFRVAQEAVRNAAEHSGGDRIDATVTATETYVELAVTDNGTGFDPTMLNGHHHGLAAIRTRCEALNGSVSVTSTGGSGAIVRARIPLRTTRNRHRVAVPSAHPSPVPAIPRHRKPDPYGNSTSTKSLV